MKSTITIFVITLTALSVYAVEVELVTNPGFEDGVIDPWVTDAWTIDTTDPHTGDYCAMVDGLHYIEQEFTPTNVDDITLIEFWVKQPEAVYVYLYLYYQGVGTPDFVFDKVYGTDWESYDDTSFLRDEGYLEKIRICGYSGISPDITCLDDVSVLYEDGTSAIESVSLGDIKAIFK